MSINFLSTNIYDTLILKLVFSILVIAPTGLERSKRSL